MTPNTREPNTPEPNTPSQPVVDSGPAVDTGPARSLIDAFPATAAFAGLRPDGLLAVLALHPSLSGPWQGFANAVVTSGVLPARLRELVILRVAWLRRSAYVWGGHVAVGRRVGVSESDLQRVTDGAAAPGLTSVEAALLDATDRMLDGGDIDGLTWATLAESFDRRVLIEVGMIVGQYVLVSCIVDVFRIPPEPGVVPLPAGAGQAADAPAA